MSITTTSSSCSTLFLSDDHVRACFDWKRAIEALRVAYSAPEREAMLPPRTIARGDGFWLRTLTCVLPDGSAMGGKMIAASLRSGQASYLVPLFNPQTAQLIALLDGSSLTGFRTAATSAMAADALAPAGALQVAVIGSGFEAKHHVRALAAIRTIQRLAVFSPNPASRARYARELEDLSLNIEQKETAEAAVRGADLIICAARSYDETPTLRGAWLSPGTTIVSIGSTLPEQRETDTEVIARADLIVADMVAEVMDETGDMIDARQAGIALDGKVVSLAAVIGKRCPGRTNADQIVLYKSVGTAVQDLTVAAMCAKRAADLGIGIPLSTSIVPVKKGNGSKSNAAACRCKV